MDADAAGMAASPEPGTVRCAQPGRLLRLTSEDFQRLVDTEPAVRARLAAILAERLQQR